VAGVYFDTSVFISIFKPEPERARKVRALLRELKRNNVRIHTSILTIQECSVVSFKRGQVLRDYHAKINALAEIHTIDKDIAVNCSKLEAEIISAISAKEQQKPRRKWDCFHIATARSLGCSTMYAWDKTMLERCSQLGITDLIFSEPVPIHGELEFVKAKAAIASGLFDIVKDAEGVSSDSIQAKESEEST
jgi:predicted nucleic acid-binding protein